MPDTQAVTWYTYNTTYPASYIFIPMNFYGWNINPSTQPNQIDIDFALPIEKQCKVKIGNAEGYECSKCKDFYPFAELNQPENAKVFIRFTCYGCRKGLNTVFENK